MEYLITLPATLAVTSREMTATLDLVKLSPEVIERAALHGLKQKVADAAAGATLAASPDKAEGETPEAHKARVAAFLASPEGKQAVADKGLALMLKVCDALERGEWGAERAAADKVSEVEARMVSMARPQAKDRITGYAAMKPKERDAAVLAFVRALPAATLDRLQALAEAALSREASEAAALGDLGGL